MFYAGERAGQHFHSFLLVSFLEALIMYLVTLQKVKPQETTGLHVTGEFQTVEPDALVALFVQVIIWLFTTVYP